RRTFRGIEGLDFLRKMLEAHTPLELQRRRHLSGFEREIASQDRESLDLLEAGEVAVDLVDGTLHGGLCSCGIDVLRERDQRCDVGAAVADDEGLRDNRMGLGRVLEFLRGTV